MSSETPSSLIDLAKQYKLMQGQSGEGQKTIAEEVRSGMEDECSKDDTTSFVWEEIAEVRDNSGGSVAAIKGDAEGWSLAQIVEEEKL